MSSGFRIRLDAFLPCSNTLADMLAASARLEDLRGAMEAAGLVDVKRSDTFVKGTRQKPERAAPVLVDQPAPATEEPPATAGEQGGADSSVDLLKIPDVLKRPRPAA